MDAGGGAPLIIQDAFILKRARVQIIVFTPQIIRGRHIVRPDGTSSRRNMGQLALIFRDQCVAGPLSIWGPGLASGVGSETRALITGVFTALLDGVRVVPDHICGESPRLSALRRQIGHYDDAGVRIEARMSKMGVINGRTRILAGMEK